TAGPAGISPTAARPAGARPTAAGPAGSGPAGPVPGIAGKVVTGPAAAGPRRAGPAAAFPPGVGPAAARPAGAVEDPAVGPRRAASSEPVPTAGSNDWVAWGGTGAVRAWWTSMTPTSFSDGTWALRSVLVNSALTWSGVRSGRLCSSRATAPDVMAAACEVPEPLNSS